MDELALLTQGTQFNPSVGVFNLAITLLLVLAISWVYRKTHKGFSYSQSFNFTIVILGLLISVVMMVIGSNLAIAFGALGAFTLIRFRTAIKDAKDTAYVFFSVVVGMAVGTGNYVIAFMSTILLIAIVLVLDRVNFGSIKKFNYVLNLSVDGNNSPNERIREVMKKYTKSDSLLSASASDHGKTMNMSFNVNFIKDVEAQTFVSDLEKIEGVNSVSLLTAKDDVEY